MTAIWYDAADDRIVVQGALQTYAPRRLIAVLDGGQLMVRLVVRTTNEFGPVSCTTITDAGGAGFATGAAALAYLQGEFAKRPAGVPGPRGPGILAGIGEPDPALGLTGDLYLDAVSGDLFSKGD